MSKFINSYFGLCLEIDCEEARGEEERMMMVDAKEWINNGEIEDVPHPKTGASALHVAAAKGYIKVMRYIVCCVNMI